MALHVDFENNLKTNIDQKLIEAQQVRFTRIPEIWQADLPQQIMITFILLSPKETSHHLPAAS